LTRTSSPDPIPTYRLHGYRFAISGSAEFAVKGLADDFAYFAGDIDGMDVRLQLDLGAPRYEGVPKVEASVYTPRNVVYRSGGVRYLDFGGRGLGVFDPDKKLFQMTSEDPHLVYEAGYLFLLSQIGQAVDRQGLHRLHALAMSYQGKAILVLLPMGGGKSTLGAALLKRNEVSILSDDSPFIDRHGGSHAFPLRLGLLKGREHEVPEEHRRLIQRMEFGPKYLVNFSYFAHRVVDRAEPGLLLLGRRTMASEGEFRPAGYGECMQALVPNLIIGLGLFQGLEYLLERSGAELVRKAGLVASRARNAHALARNSKRYVFAMGRDVDRNAGMVVELARRHFGG
jgi:hypothetical protein